MRFHLISYPESSVQRLRIGELGRQLLGEDFVAYTMAYATFGRGRGDLHYWIWLQCF